MVAARAARGYDILIRSLYSITIRLKCALNADKRNETKMFFSGGGEIGIQNQINLVESQNGEKKKA